jgi:hypothetical protein
MSTLGIQAHPDSVDVLLQWTNAERGLGVRGTDDGLPTTPSLSQATTTTDSAICKLERSGQSRRAVAATARDCITMIRVVRICALAHCAEARGRTSHELVD